MIRIKRLIVFQHGPGHHQHLGRQFHTDKQVLPDGKLCFTFRVNDKFRYPLKVVAVEKPDSLAIVTAYPLKKVR